ncbi:hypothetical protein EYC84_010959 [Monilinia fructicola]|uniref:Uncharacterized protein n=1 Tax=Monilinia fructicola TaxID=38448 RepID=A0A5M9J6Q9_MONFR|nr:hypothetical protein EYC84_010959 [Monilinia fructicola]
MEHAKIHAVKCSFSAKESNRISYHEHTKVLKLVVVKIYCLPSSHPSVPEYKLHRGWRGCRTDYIPGRQSKASGLYLCALYSVCTDKSDKSMRSNCLSIHQSTPFKGFTSVAIGYLKATSRPVNTKDIKDITKRGERNFNQRSKINISPTIFALPHVASG